VELHRPDGRVGTLTQPGQPTRRIALQRRSTQDCLVEELRRLDPDEVYEAALHGLGKITTGTNGKTAATPPPKADVTSPGAAAAATKAPADKAPAPAAKAKAGNGKKSAS
jgi:hypothetical protein